jgi:hypothetical protein
VITWMVDIDWYMLSAHKDSSCVITHNQIPAEGNIIRNVKSIYTSSQLVPFVKGSRVGSMPIGPILIRWVVLTVGSSHLMFCMIIKVAG